MPIPEEINNSKDTIDSRDVIARIEWLDDDDLCLDEEDELKSLKALQEECEGYSDWIHGALLIRDSYFIQYAEQFAEDIGAIDRDANWPLNHIDWEEAASELKMDYTCVDFDGVDYWLRSF